MRRDGKLSFAECAGRGIFAVALLIAFGLRAQAQLPEPPPRIAFEISTGSTTGTYFPVAQSIAQLLSHPPGVERCEIADVCGPAGLIVSTRASAGSLANVIAVNAGATNSALAQADAVAAAIAGRGAFLKTGRATSVRVIANLYTEDVHLIAAQDAKISTVEDLRGKRVGISTEGSGTLITARAILSAYRLSERTIVPNYDSADKAIDLLQSGQLDALFFVGGAPVDLVEQLLSTGTATVVAIGGEGRDRLLAREPRLSARVIPEATYESLPAIDTVGVDALWITNEAEPEALVYAMTKALFHAANRASLDSKRAGMRILDIASAVPVGFPIHPGAMRYFVEAGLVKPPEVKDSPPPAGPIPNKS
jgi:TRAP transporter TAXI family solute receptor